MVQVTADIHIEDDAIQEQFVRAAGPGGQHVNKSSTAVQLQVPLDAIVGLSDGARARLVRRAGKRLSEDGVLTIKAGDHRSQYRNRQAALDRLLALVRSALPEEKPRRPTKPGRAAKERRIAKKKQRGQVKSMRGKVSRDD
jgi:ribosome-associated protein